MKQQDSDKIIQLVQACTRNLMSTFREKTDSLRECSKDVKLLLREGYDKKVAYETALKLFGKDKTKFVAIDGTESEDQELDMLVFYAGSFGYVGQITFENTGKGCAFDEPIEIEANMSISAAVPVHEQDTANVAGKATEGGVEVDTERIPSSLMHLSEYYMAVKAVIDDPEIQIVIVDRTLAGDVGHLVWSVNEMLDSNGCILQGLDTPSGEVTALDLDLTRMMHPNDSLKVPSARSHLLKYAAIAHLIKENRNGNPAGISYDELLKAIGARPERIEKLKKDMTKFNEKYSLLDGSSFGTCRLAAGVDQYWDRVSAASMKICDYIFNTPEGKHPLIFEGPWNSQPPKPRWITANDLDYLVLVMVYALLRLAWERQLLVIGIIKDVSAGELVKTVVPLLRSAGRITLGQELPKFNSDKMLLQTASVINSADTSAPWRTVEFDACLRTVAPKVSLAPPRADQPVNVAGAFKNVISTERMFVKSYIQLWSSENDPAVRSHVFSYDRPCYPEFDLVSANEMVLSHKDGDVDEDIRPIIHFDQDSAISHVVMDILCSMASEVIPECLGHNYPLFLADKKAKSVLQGSKAAYLSAISYEMASSEFDQQVLFEARFREYRSQLESKRRRSGS